MNHASHSHPHIKTLIGVALAYTTFTTVTDFGYLSYLVNY